jgi:hypothetical protein
VAALLISLALADLGCSVETGEVPRAGECPPFELVDISPPDEAVDVSPDVAITYAFTDFPEPDSAVHQNFGIYSGPFYYTAFESVDLIRRAITFKPTSSLPRGIGFTLALSPRVTSLRGCALAQPPLGPTGVRPTAYYFSFRTVEPNVTVPRPDPVPPPATFAQVLQVMAARCAGGCHLPDPDPDSGASEICTPAPAGGVSLCSREAYGSIVGVTSRQVGRLAIVAPHDSARSYLLRKLLGAPPTTGHRAPPGNVISDDELVLIQSWIDAGAPNR